ncbi:MAG: DUF6090 family protein [Verrucomicrobia bacterium]|nr:DUF6090 family protein [Verrucomicrobiota bacterium]MDA1068100.1 DUF6090 family protein [Verrucomicrobiota bacterium]
MILRRVIEHYKKQEWTAIWIDFVIVVVGVFIGLQVNNWNETRTDRFREAIYLAGVSTDVRSDIVDIEEIIRVSTSRMSAMTFLLECASGSALPDGFDSARGRIEIENAPPYQEDDPNSIGIALFILTTFEGNRLVYDTMINTGGIGIIRNAELLREIQTYYAHVDKVLHFETQLEENRVKLVDAQQQSGISPVDLLPARDLAQRFTEDPSLLAAAKNYWLFTNRHLKLMNDLKRDAEMLVAEIKNADKA